MYERQIFEGQWLLTSSELSEEDMAVVRRVKIRFGANGLKACLKS